MKALNEILDLARAEIGVKETGQNYVKYNDWFWGTGVGGPDYPWCVVFLTWLFNANETGVEFPLVAHCNGVAAWARERKQLVQAPYKVGDCIIFDYDGDDTYDHIGIVEEVRKDGKLVTIEGNYSDKVARVVRDGNSIVCAYRPRYDVAEEATESDQEPSEPEETFCTTVLPVLREGDVGTAVGSLQGLLELRGYRPKGSKTLRGGWDKEFGPGTYEALVNFQTSVNVSPCEIGTTGPETWAALIFDL